jgi:hypothetical protein
VAFEGQHFWNVTTALPFTTNFQVPVVALLLVWGLIVYFIAIKVFKWES